MMTKSILVLFLFVASCVYPDPKPVVATDVMVHAPVSVEAPKLQNSVTYKSMFPRSEWKQFTLDALDKYGKELLSIDTPKDASTYNYKGGTLEERKAFWLYLISAMAWRESNFKPETSFEESGHLEGVTSRGLLQISLDSGKSYNKALKTAKELHDPKINLETAVMILNRWVPKDGYIGTNKKGGARYWSVLREHSGSRPKIIEKMKK